MPQYFVCSAVFLLQAKRSKKIVLKPPKALALKISPEFLLQIKVAMNTSVVSNVSVDIYCTTIRPQNFERGTWNVDQFERLQYSSGVSVSFCIQYYHACRA